MSATLWFLTALISQVIADDLQIVAELSDGHREIMAVMDEYFYNEANKNYWDTLSGSMTIGSMLMVLGMSIGISLICAWLRYKWTSLLGAARDSRSRMAMAGHACRISHYQDTVISVSDTPPPYDELFNSTRSCSSV